jgi:Bacterial regulatory proteins, luxR family
VLEVLAALARGRFNRQIARALRISEETVKAHVSSNGWIAAAWRWRNWCGSRDVTVRYVGLQIGVQPRALPPRCLDPARPSTLERVPWPN